jgi:DNA-binding NtrC family response regulator
MPTISHERHTKPKILIVDDDGDIAEVLAFLLEDDFFCERCTKADEALGKIKSNSYDALVTDLEMPDCPGVQLIRHVREMARQMKIFICTAHDFTEPKVQEALHAGAAEVLHKPFLEPDLLIDSMKKHLS